jgi:beta-phosphoglucomutase-like phosphatase (HAD superfamily)
VLAGEPGIRAVVFDLDEALLDTRRAWQYAIEESIAMVCERRISAEPLVAEYRRRPFAHALAILVEAPAERARCGDLCAAMFERSGMKRLLVHEGIGMALDAVRAGRIEMGAISRSPHGRALKQVQSTGLDRFLAVLSATADGEAWDPAQRYSHCLRFLERDAAQAAYVGVGDELRTMSAAGAPVFEAAYASPEPSGFEPIATPHDIVATLRRLSTQH